MKTWQLVISRLFFKLFGWVPGISQFVKQILVRRLIKHSSRKYVASSRYFSWMELDQS